MTAMRVMGLLSGECPQLDHCPRMQELYQLQGNDFALSRDMDVGWVNTIQYQI
jgi:hypothetical protein